MKNSEDELIVLFPTDTQEEGTIHELPDPFSGEMRSYWKYGTTLYELNTIHDDDKYTSFCIGNTILASNKLHVSTPVDPLFWLVYFCTSSRNTTSSSSTAWQPLDQLLQTVCGSYYTLLSESLLIDTSQCRHVLATLTMDDDDVYYKFSPDTTLAWLTRKQQNVLVNLRQRRQERETKADAACGAFVEGFVLGGVENKEASTNKQKVNNDPTPATDSTPSTAEDHPDDVAASYQLIGNYISANLRQQWSTQRGIDPERIWGRTSSSIAKKPKHAVGATPSAEEWNAAALGRTSSETKEVVVKPTAVTAGAKRLQKVNKRGLQKMSAFFSSKKK